MIDPDAPSPGGGKLFVDRVPESRSFAESLAVHTDLLRADRIDTRAMRHVLTFYGEGGLGKTELSSRFNSWLRGSIQDDAGWGPPPAIKVDASVVWDSSQSHGQLDPLDLLLELRRQMATVREVWAPFDLALHAMHRAIRPGTSLVLDTPSGITTTLSDVVGSIVSEGAGMLVPGAGILVDGGRSALSLAREHSRARTALQAHPELADLIRDCERLPGSPRTFAEVAGRVAFMLTRDLNSLPAASRPVVIVFADHFERLQDAGDSPLGESLLNRLVVRLPHFLFVITGRNSVRWHEPDSTTVEVRGAHRWPLLVPDNVSTEPRQHAIGYLSEPDAETFLRESFHRGRILVEPGAVEQLVSAAGGWPLHLDTIVALGQQNADPSKPLTVDDLSGPLPQLVERLLRGMPHDESEAFRAGCLLPYFDVQLAARAAGVTAGAVERLIKRTIVRSNPMASAASTYPYRIHDTLRNIVREAGAKATHGWSSSDWAQHADLAVNEAQHRFTTAMREDDDPASTSSLALALNLASENNIFDDWLIEGVKSAPGVRALGPLIPSAAPSGLNCELADLLTFIRLRERDQREHVGPELAELMERGNAIASSAGLWLSYEHRRLGRADASVRVLDILIERYPDRADFYRFQQALTLALSRRFIEANDRIPLLKDRHRVSVEQSISRSHGIAAGAADKAEERANSTNSRRFQIELLGDSLTYRLREGSLTVARAEEVYAMAARANHDVALAQAASVKGQLSLFDDYALSVALDETADLSRRRWQPYATHATLLAIAAWARSDDSLLAQTVSIADQAVHRNSAWIAVEILLAEMGRPVSTTPSTWLESEEEVRSRWLSIVDQIVEGARSRS